MIKESYKESEISKEVIIQILDSYFESKKNQANKESSRLFQEIFIEYLQSIAGKGSPVAFANKVRISKIILDDLGIKKLCDINYDLVSIFLNSLTSREYKKNGKDSLYSQAYINKIFLVTRSAIQYMENRDLISEPFSHKLEKPISRKYQEKIQKALTPEEIKMLIDAMEQKPMLQALITVLAYTGIRPGEAYALKITDFDFEKRTVKIDRALSVDIKTDIKHQYSHSSRPVIKSLKNEIGSHRECAHRVLTVGENVIRAILSLRDSETESIKELKRIKGTSDYIFTAPTDGELKRPDYYINEYRRQLKSKNINGNYNFYRFRHTYCTMLFRDLKLNPKTVQYLMGDNSLDMVIRVYHSVNKNDLISASADFSKIMDTLLK